MTRSTQEIDIAGNIRLIEWLKAEIINGVASLFRALLKNSQDLTTEALANIITACYFLGERVGLSFEDVDTRIVSRLKSHLEDEHQLEKWHGDISRLLRYYRSWRNGHEDVNDQK